MTPLLKAYGFSLVIHATIIVALYVIPAASTKRFDSSGNLQVVLLDSSQEAPATISTTVSVTAPPTTPLSSADSPIDPAAATESLEPRLKKELLDRLETERPDLPKLASPSTITDPKADAQPSWKRREFVNEPRLPPVVEVIPQRTRSSGIAIRPPAAFSSAAEQFAGLKEKRSADLSKNQPPGYPTEAIRGKLEGVVMLRLQIAATGKVESVELIKSSGHPILDQAAINAVARWEGEPAKRWGRPIESTELLPIRFRL